MWPFTATKWPEVSQEEIRKRARIVVVDDQEFYYLGLFQRDGYTIEKWDDIEDLQKLEGGYFDIILLDIQGVGRQQSHDEGLGIIRHLKEARPGQIIIAYSNADWPLQYKDFFDLADATLPKQGDYVDFKRVVDQLLELRFSLSFYLDRITAVAAAGLGPADLTRLHSAARKSILRRNPRGLEKALAQVGLDANTVNVILQLAQTAIALLSLLHGGK